MKLPPPGAPSAAPRRSRLIGHVLRALAIFLGLVGPFAIFVTMELLTVYWGLDWPRLICVAFALLIFLSSACYVLYSRAKRHLSSSAVELQSRDKRPPVLYLRSFRADDIASRSPEMFDKTEEEIVARILDEIGPVIAIGKPGEQLPALGASRVYVGQDEWKETVQSYMDDAKLVVLRLGSTMGFWWELNQSIKTLDPTRLLLLTPYEKEHYDVFRLQAAGYFPRPLPDYVESRSVLPGPLGGFRTGWVKGRLGSLRGLVYFNSDWTAEYVDLVGARWTWRYALRFFARPLLSSKLKWALRPVYRRLFVLWRPPAIRWLVLATFSMMICNIFSVAVAVCAPENKFLAVYGKMFRWTFFPASLSLLAWALLSWRLGTIELNGSLSGESR